MTCRVTEVMTYDEMVATPGSVKFYAVDGEEKAGFSFSCPCGCRGIWGVRLKGAGAWNWNGSVENMTITPSVNAMATPNVHEDDRTPRSHWHGFVTDGEWRRC